METVRILAIGNSFSQDAAYYLHQLTEAAGRDVQVVNLYIGGCPLELHWQNIRNDARAYQYQQNGVMTERYVSIDEMLEEEEWDHIVTQQASHDSGWLETYEPFLGLILEHLRAKAPAARLWLQETWAYEVGSRHDRFPRYHCDQRFMYEKLHACYTQMAEKYGLGLIPSGTVIQKARKHPEFDVSGHGLSLCRDGFHMSYSYGRYLLACVWAKTLLGLPVEGLPYTPASPMVAEPCDPSLLALIREIVEEE